MFFEEDLEDEESHVSLHQLEWEWDADSENDPDDLARGLHMGFIATLRLYEGETGPMGAEGPCFAVYRKRHRDGEISATFTPL